MGREETLIELLNPVLEECGVRLYELKWISGKENTLQIAVMKEDGTMDLDTCVAVSEKVSEVLDEKDPVPEGYTLEVCSPGAEREIRDLSELYQMQGQYIYIRLRTPVKKMSEITGEVISAENGILTISYRDKAATRKAETEFDNITFARLAVRL